MGKLLITGSSGMLGSNIVSELGEKYEVFGTYKNFPNPTLKNQVKIDLTDLDRVRTMVDSVNPDFVVHCVALTNVDACEENYILARATNAFATKNLVSSLRSETRFIYISTDSIFDGKRGKYSEANIPHPLNNYAKSKLEGEQFVKQQSNYVIIRTNIFGWNCVERRESFVEWVYNNLRKKKPIKMFTDVIFSPITVNTLSSFIDKLLNMDFVGTLNIGSVDPISKYDFGILLADLFNLDKSSITPVKVDTFRFKAKRPKNTSLNVSKAKDIFGFLPTIEDELKKFYEIKEKNKKTKLCKAKF